MTVAAQFRVRAVDVQAMQWPAGRDDVAAEQLCGWVNSDGAYGASMRPLEVSPIFVAGLLTTARGAVPVKPGDWVVRGGSGEFHVCDAALFTSIYRPVAAMAESAVPVDQC